MVTGRRPHGPPPATFSLASRPGLPSELMARRKKRRARRYFCWPWPRLGHLPPSHGAAPLPPDRANLAWVSLLRFPRVDRALLLGAALAVAGQAGDLVESLIKRSVAVKDSGRVVPAFGGLLDILDSPLVCAPVAYWMMLK